MSVIVPDAGPSPLPRGSTRLVATLNPYFSAWRGRLNFYELPPGDGVQY